MKVREWIKVFQGMPQDYTVKLADWNEEYREPQEDDTYCVCDDDKAVILGASEVDPCWR